MKGEAVHLPQQAKVLCACMVDMVIHDHGELPIRFTTHLHISTSLTILVLPGKQLLNCTPEH